MGAAPSASTTVANVPSVRGVEAVVEVDGLRKIMLDSKESISFDGGGGDPAHHDGVKILLDESWIDIEGSDEFRLKEQTERLLEFLDRTKLEALEDVKYRLGWERARLVEPSADSDDLPLGGRDILSAETS